MIDSLKVVKTNDDANFVQSTNSVSQWSVERAKKKNIKVIPGKNIIEY